ncbi:bis(5'-nucleosyl)-tetraphosphatase (symmetrical) YqeK [Sphaerochaeta halotolerans]|uniref:bis(5'-nucleosyl)-tetraphosphatase (symmetrical) YqeK n=1 Tax=Sphaerochaeta halotolerans TaxID=2293840 RepID=UPI00136F85F4|nr:bis(5'-nucleosyl)-tetraphosphatase (symmetrical) YqeK [Sphaerochaeta halotolerans]MXI85737.1 HD domain-containing protein [Sphaerochaeta halotolerans]
MSSHFDSTALEQELAKILPPQRYQHSVAVGETCVRLQHQYQEKFDEQELYQCGLMHDIARDWKVSALTQFAEEHHLSLEKEERDFAVLLHAPVGAALLEERGFPKQLCIAVRYHTIGSIHMGRMGLLLYIADYIEPNRMHLDDGDRASLLGEPTLEALCIRILEAESMHLRSKGKEITHSGLALRTLLKEGGRL